MSKKFKQQDGFVLLESLSALSIITLALVFILPLVITLYQTREQKKVEVESYRLLYDYTSEWNGDVQQHEAVRMNETFYIFSDRWSHRVEDSQAVIEKVELISYELEE